MRGKGSAPVEGIAGVSMIRTVAAQKLSTRRVEDWKGTQGRTCSSLLGFMCFD